MENKQQKTAMKGNLFVSFAIILLFAIMITPKLAQARAPSSSDCMSNPFASGCRGISAKRSPSSYRDESHQSASFSQWGQYPQQNGVGRTQGQTRGSPLSELLFKSSEQVQGSMAAIEQVVASRPVIGKFYLYEVVQQPTVPAAVAATTLGDEHPLEGLDQSHEEH